MKRGKIILSSFILLILLAAPVLAQGDIAYIFKNPFHIDQEVLNVFREMGFTVDKIQERNLPSDLSSYKLIFIGEERFSQNIPFYNNPTIIANHNNLNEFGLTDKDGGSRTSSNQPLSVNHNSMSVQVYTHGIDITNTKKLIHYNYIANKNKATEMTRIAGTYEGSLTRTIGDVISYIDAGTTLGNGKTTAHNICFFGITQSNWWTNEAREMFKDCIEFVAGPPDVHDVALVDLTNSIGRIKLEETDGTDITGNELQCNTNYKIGIKAKNNGDFTENITYTGSVDSLLFEHLPTPGLKSGNTSTKTKTVNFALAAGDYTITVEAHLADTLTDATPLDNIASRSITILCPSI